MLEVEWIFHMGTEQFVVNWLIPYHHPLLIQLWNVPPPNVYWGIWKERKNRVFRNEERNEKVMTGLIVMLLVENMQNSKWRKPSSLPMLSEQRVARNWKLEEGFAEVDNSK